MFAAEISVAISKTSVIITFICHLPLIGRILWGPFSLLIVTVYYYLIRTCLIVVILQLIFHVIIRTAFILSYDKMAGKLTLKFEFEFRAL